MNYRRDSYGNVVEHFDEACAGLLREILVTAGIAPHGSLEDATLSSTRRPISILDLGFGCGDQTIALAKHIRPADWQDFRYVGLTLNESQLSTAIKRLHRESTVSADQLKLDPDSFKMFPANAAKPDTWSSTIRDAVYALADARFQERWLLALDCLYHFSPSRKPVFSLAAQNLQAGVMAFDLILNERATWRDKLFAKLIVLIMNCPWNAFLTEQEYRHQLVECGYDSEQIIIRDISDNVFAGVTDYLQRQEHALSQYGISIGGYKLAGRLFGWFDRTRVVRASIVVARPKRPS